MAQEADDILQEYLVLKAEVERQHRTIEELTRPRHWTQAGPRGSQATAVHQALDTVLEQGVRVRNLLRPGRSSSAFETELGARDSGTAAAGTDRRDGAFTRLRQAADVLGGAVGDGTALAAFLDAAERSSRSRSQLAWLGLVSVLGRYPSATELDAATRSIGNGGLTELGEILREHHLDAQFRDDTSSSVLGIRVGAVIIDVTHTARNDLHTGIQRVVREIGSRWLSDPRSVLVWWDHDRACLRELGYVETFRFRDWANHLAKESGAAPVVRDFDATPDAIVVPWDSTFLLPELAADPKRSGCYIALAGSGVIERFGAIGFDLVPVTAAETVHHGMVCAFPSHLSVIKHADRLSAISNSAADEFRAFGSALAAQGLSGPDVMAHLLPPSPFEVSADEIARVRATIADEEVPVIVVVGSREPRKNQIAVLDAALHLSRTGAKFHLVMVGGSGWNSEDIDDQIDRVRSLGIEITLRTRATESELFAWYRIARFTVFPSLYEGYGLPIAESLEAGTPVITSDYGAMREVAAPGGALLVDPRDHEAVRAAMQRLLDDDELLERLTIEARARTWPTWDEYARDVWDHLVGPDEAANT